MNRQTYPIPEGYRMLKHGEVIRPDDLYWYENGFIPVFPMGFHGQLADPDKHPCLIRATETVLNPDDFCYSCGVRLLDGKSDIYCTVDGSTAYFHSDACKDEWWHRGDRATPKEHCEGCGKDMHGAARYTAARTDDAVADIMACSQFCFEACQHQNVPIQSMMTDEEIAANRARLAELDSTSEKRADQIRPNYYKQGGIEVIGIIRAFKLGFNLGNVLKYILRAGLKSENRLQDLQKANTYLQFELTEEHEKDGK